MNNKVNKKLNKGSTILTTPIVIAIGILIITSIISLAVNIIMPYIWYEKLSSTCIKYIYVMEEFGYLTKKEINNLEKELEKQGFEMEDMKISYTSTRVEYGSPIFLEVKYNYKIDMPIGNNIDVPMNIKRTSVSKR